MLPARAGAVGSTRSSSPRRRSRSSRSAINSASSLSPSCAAHSRTRSPQAPRKTMASKAEPAWLALTDRLMSPIVNAAMEQSTARASKDLTLNTAGHCAIIHFGHCIDSSIALNRKGQHAPALCLVRQCVEALTIVELALLPIDVGD